MRVATRLVGTSPLLQHNIRLANPDDLWAKKIAAITAKRKKTEEDRAAISKLEFEGSLYVDNDHVVVPKTNIRKCFQEAAKVTKRGRDITRAVNAMPPLTAPLMYDGPDKIDDLVADQSFYDVTSVGVGQSRVLRTRPIFHAWAVTVEWELVSNVMELDAFADIVRLAGIIEGLGDNRTGGYGRFDAEVREL